MSTLVFMEKKATSYRQENLNIRENISRLQS